MRWRANRIEPTIFFTDPHMVDGVATLFPGNLEWTLRGAILAPPCTPPLVGDSMMWRHSQKLLTGSMVGWLILVVTATAQEPPHNTIGVTGRGKVKVAPTTVELVGLINIEAELAADALTKFRTTKQTVTDAIQKIGATDLTLEIGGFGIGPSGTGDSTAQMIINRSRGAAPEPPKVVIQESVRLRLKQIDKIEREKLYELLTKVIDAAKEAGVVFGPPPGSNRLSINRDEFQSFATFSIDDAQTAREQAESQAIQDARTRADRLAKLANCGLGEVRSLRETIRTSDFTSSLGRPVNPEQSQKLEEIEISATIQVEFKLIPRG